MLQPIIAKLLQLRPIRSQISLILSAHGGAVASWLVCSTPERAVDRYYSPQSGLKHWPGTLCCVFWARHFTLTVPLSTQVYKYKPVNLMLGVTLCALNANQRYPLKQWIALKARSDWLVKLRISFAIYL